MPEIQHLVDSAQHLPRVETTARRSCFSLYNSFDSDRVEWIEAAVLFAAESGVALVSMGTGVAARRNLERGAAVLFPRVEMFLKPLES